MPTRLASFWLPVVLIGLILMCGALAYAFAPIASIYSQALQDPLGGNGANDASLDGKLLMRTVFMRLPLAIPGLIIWIFGAYLRIRSMLAKRTASQPRSRA